MFDRPRSGRQEDRRRSRRLGVLVVEDQPMLSKLVVTALRRERLSVDTAGDGAAAIRHLENGSYCAIVLDLMMPGVSGWDVIRWMGEHPDKKPRSVIVVTATDRDVVNELDPLIVNAIIFKPFDVFELSAYVRACCTFNARRDRRSRRIVT